MIISISTGPSWRSSWVHHIALASGCVREHCLRWRIRDRGHVGGLKAYWWGNHDHNIMEWRSFMREMNAPRRHRAHFFRSAYFLFLFCSFPTLMSGVVCGRADYETMRLPSSVVHTRARLFGFFSWVDWLLDSSASDLIQWVSRIILVPICA